MLIRMCLKGKYDYIEDEDVIVFDDKVISYYQRLFPNYDVVKKLKLLTQVFRYFPNMRCSTKQELDAKIRKWIVGNVNDEEQIKRLVPDYIPLIMIEELELLLGGNKYDIASM